MQNHTLSKLELRIAAIKTFSCPAIEDFLSSMASLRITVVALRLSFAFPLAGASQFKPNDWNMLNAILDSSIDCDVVVRVVVPFRVWCRELGVWRACWVGCICAAEVRQAWIGEC